jgi:glutathione synthase/RimK-type ligase-like ATP-grasp enzyme
VSVRIALATSDELPALDPDSALLLPELAALGVDARPEVWTDPAVDWAAYDAVVVRSVWDYFERADEFDDWVRRVGPAARRFVNPPDVVAWNTHKTYLRDLGERGVPIVDTAWLAAGETATVPFAEAVVKPAVSGGSIGLRRASGGERIAATEDLMVQPLLASIADEGELSLLFADGDLTHMVRKVPAAGDIRSQPEFGSTVTAEAPTAEMLDVARSVLAAVGRVLPYARVDLVRAADGTLRLIELEVIEPQLYLRWDEGSPARFAGAIAAAARSA